MNGIQERVWSRRGRLPKLEQAWQIGAGVADYPDSGVRLEQAWRGRRGVAGVAKNPK